MDDRPIKTIHCALHSALDCAVLCLCCAALCCAVLRCATLCVGGAVRHELSDQRQLHSGLRQLQHNRGHRRCKQGVRWTVLHQGRDLVGRTELRRAFLRALQRCKLPRDVVMRHRGRDAHGSGRRQQRRYEKTPNPKRNAFFCAMSCFLMRNGAVCPDRLRTDIKKVETDGGSCRRSDWFCSRAGRAAAAAWARRRISRRHGDEHGDPAAEHE
jgi:hypothetical protein